MFGAKQFKDNPGYPTPTSIPATTSCLVLQIPESAAWWSVYVGLLYTLTLEETWQQFDGGISREDAAAAALDIFLAAWQQSLSASCATTAPTPFWDEDVDVDDEAANDVQTWYGYVSDLDNPTTTFVEDAAIWTFAGFLAVAGAPAAAIAFQTLAPRFVVAIRRGDLGEIIRIYLDGSEAAEIDTSGLAAGEVLEQPLVASGAAPHNLMLVRIS